MKIYSHAPLSTWTSNRNLQLNMSWWVSPSPKPAPLRPPAALGSQCPEQTSLQPPWHLSSHNHRPPIKLALPLTFSTASTLRVSLVCLAWMMAHIFTGLLHPYKWPELNGIVRVIVWTTLLPTLQFFLISPRVVTIHSLQALNDLVLLSTDLPSTHPVAPARPPWTPSHASNTPGTCPC